MFGGGCFWCAEAVFRRLKGVISVKPGYAGGRVPNPTYHQICTMDTGHAEVIRVDFDSDSIDLDTLLSVFFATHDPTTPNRQGNDSGPQYRSIILCNSEEQASIVKRFIETLEQNKTFSKSIVTELKPLDTFYEAEEYHKAYYEKNRDEPYCQFVIDPKVAKLRQRFSHLLSEEKT